MTFPPGAIAANKTNETPATNDHPEHHNLLATAVNDTVAQLVAVNSRHLATFSKAGVLSVVTGTSRFVFPFPVTVLGATLVVSSAPVGAAIKVDVNLNGTTIFTTQANRPTIADGATVGSEAAPDVTAVLAGQYLTVDVDQVGSSTPGSNLTVVVRYAT